MYVLDLFSGIGGFSLAAELICVRCMSACLDAEEEE